MRSTTTNGFILAIAILGQEIKVKFGLYRGKVASNRRPKITPSVTTINKFRQTNPNARECFRNTQLSHGLFTVFIPVIQR
jgi:hypothetical protein